MSKVWQETVLNSSSAPLFVVIDEDFIRQKSNEEHIRAQFPDIDNLIENIIHCKEINDNTPKMKNKTKQLFRILHHDYLETEKGMDKLIEKYNTIILPRCPRVYCNGARCFPVGVERDGAIFPKMICPACREVYNLPPPFDVLQNGESFGDRYIEKFFEKYKDKLPERVEEKPYEPRIFGFKVKQHKEPLEPEKLEK
ncbi:Casein kinase II regulatory subunit family protein [Trichomonas vaginalis G3]|uniref:Casein kinase II subunit beta n=1 Tax=Trichomonas vaginalis (strain ATCC PRA-98 / G3) TaxID=412133 RepID=A2END2_TRIV3|nr:protein kinase regulator protein [Trichomonas vaginalis G3]EAY05802.1 Casein kinase II regulatory subunit family protein [Trichomonas vaginalis G3]KAI5516341.1 protein kinase regulator protein [Trichomonas vaginalis G3]|eukprot:XP_001318025.1 Casein kinase II regulatory subunit family protein [Trichomonas vaginalis G3]